MNKQTAIAIILAALLALALTSVRAHGAAPTNTPVSDFGPTWTAIVHPTSSVATNTPVVDVQPYPTSTQMIDPVIGDPWTWGPCLWLPVVIRP